MSSRATHDLFRFGDIYETSQSLPPLQGYEFMPSVSFDKAVEPLIPHVPDIQRMAHVVRGHSTEKTGGLTIDESASIALYSMEWTPKENSFYYVLNQTLRARNREKMLSPWLLYLKLFMTALSKLPSFVDQLVYRGIRKDLKDHYRVGSCVVWEGFSSCTPRLHVLENAPFFSLSDTRTLFSIHCTTGKNIKEHTFLGIDDEIVFLPGQEFEVVSSMDMGNNLHAIHLKEIQYRFPHMPPAVPTTNYQVTTKLSVTKENVPQTIQPSSSPKPPSEKTTIQTRSMQKRRKIIDGDIPRIVEDLISKKQFTQLDLSWSMITYEGAAIIAKILLKNQTLTSVDLRGNDINEIGAQHLAEALRQNKILTTLNLGGDLFFGFNSIGDLGTQCLANALKQNQTLTTLDIGSNQITDVGTTELAQVLKENQTLLTLNIHENRITEIGAERIADALRHNSTLTTLNLGKNKIGNVGAQYIGDALRQNKKLAILNLEHNFIGDRGGEYIADMLRQNMTLTTLDLRQNEFSHITAERFAAVLQQNTTLAVLHLHSNKIGETGAQNFANVLKHNMALKVLGLGGRLFSNCNNIGDTGAQYIADSLKHNRTLTTLDLGFNEITDTGVQYLANILSHNKKLVTLNLENNKIGDKGAQQLAVSLRSHRSLQEMRLCNNNISLNVQKKLEQQDNRIKISIENK